MMQRITGVAAVLVTMCGAAPVAAQHANVSGTITYRERIALPPAAVVEITLEDVSRADAPPDVIARVRTQAPGNPPIPFDLPYDLNRIDQRNRYAVRARILDGDRVLFMSTDAALVLTQGRGATVSVLVRQMSAARDAAPASRRPLPDAAAPVADAPEPAPLVRPLPPAVELTNLPATFTGTLPCADCQGLRYELNLFPDDSFFLRTTYQGSPAASATRDDWGSYVLSSDRRVIILRGAGGTTELFSIRDNSRLRKLDQQGQAIGTTLNYDLRRSPSFAPLALRGSFRGAYAAIADTGRFIECASGKHWSVSDESSNGALQSAYRSAAAKPGQPVLVNLQGRLSTRPRADGSGTETTLVVESVGAVTASGACEKRFAGLPLEDTYWRLTSLGSTTVGAAANARNEPSLTFRTDPKLFSGSGGCNRLAGQYQIGSDSLTLRAAGTMMACPGMDETERAFTRALNDTRRYRVLGTVLELSDERGRVLARFEGK